MKAEYIEVDYETITNKEKRELRALINSVLLNGFTREDFDDVLAVIARVVGRIESCGVRMAEYIEHGAV